LEQTNDESQPRYQYQEICADCCAYLVSSDSQRCRVRRRITTLLTFAGNEMVRVGLDRKSTMVPVIFRVNYLPTVNRQYFYS